MKQCPDCKRVYYDNSLNFCLEDGATLIESPPGEPITAILLGEIPPSELSTRRHKTIDEESSPADTERATRRRHGSALSKTSWIAVGSLVLIIAAGLLAYRYLSGADSDNQINSVAVIPFENLNANADTDYLSDGISEALINSLTELQQIKVVARSTAFRYKGKDIDPKTVGRELNVGAVLMGRVRQVGDSLDIQVDLVDTSSGTQLWGQEYERSLSDVITIKQTIAREVTEKLRLRLTGDQQQRLTRTDTSNAEAYQFYLRGRYLWNKRTPESLNKAIEQFQKATEIDSNYALGYVGLADCYLLQEELAGVSPGESLLKARAAIDNALRIDDSLAEAHTSSALIFEGVWQWPQAEAEYKHAISLKPNYPTAHHWFSIYLRKKGQIDDSMNEIVDAQKLDPLSSIIGQNKAELYLLKNDLDSAVQQCKSIIDLDPGFPGAHNELAWAYLKQRRNAEAVVEFRKAVELSAGASRYQADLGYCYAVTGRRSDALEILKILQDKYSKNAAVGQYLASVYSGLGDKDQAFAWLEKDLDRRSGIRLPYCRWWYPFENLHSDPRYTSILRRMGL
jgi:TolB-like protein/Tfp pilus assembly protein PilF